MLITCKNTIFHVHTYRCGHAGEEKEREYVTKAIELGAKELVFTDHGPFPGNPFYQRMKIEELEQYVSVLKELKEEYAGILEIKIGLEIEFLPSFVKYYRELKEQWKMDVLLLGQHFSQMPDNRYTFELEDKSKEMYHHAEGILAGMKMGCFDAVAHPDQIFRYMDEWTLEMEEIADDIKVCAVKTGTVLENNISNMVEKNRKNIYRPEFWMKLPENLQVIYGVDAHSVKEMEENYKKLQQNF